MSEPSIAKPITLRESCFWAAMLVVFDAFVLNMGVISFFVGVGVLLFGFPRAIFFTKDPALRRYRLARAGIFLVAATLVIGWNKANNLVARSRAETVIAAVKAFHRQNQRYPEKLEELVPDFIDHIPSPKYALRSSFQYRSWPTSHTLVYASIPPFYRAIYYFEHDKWGYMD